MINSTRSSTNAIFNIGTNKVGKISKNDNTITNKIKLDLSDSSFPTRTNRLEAVENMKKVLKIHNYDITDKVPTEPTKFTDARDHHEIMQKGIVR